MGAHDGLVNAGIKAEVSGISSSRSIRKVPSLAKVGYYFKSTRGPFQAAMEQAQGRLAQSQGQTERARAVSAGAGCGGGGEYRERQEALAAALTDRLRLASIRYRGGIDTQLDALDAGRDLFQAELDL
jgi:hypothetical protein